MILKIFFLLCFSTICFSLESDENCGTIDQTKGLIIDGQEVKPNKWPWSVAVFHKEDGVKYKMICGGTLITRMKVITAAHCIHEKYSKEKKRVENFILKLGAHDLSKNEPQTVTVAPVKITVHSEWKPEELRFDADIAVMDLPREISISKFIRPICLWERRRGAPRFTTGIVVGWGVSDVKKNLPENIAREITIPIVTNEQCFLDQRQFSLLSSNRTFCGGAKSGQGPCRGDSGSGLYFKRDDKFYLGGIVSASALDVFKNCDVKNYAIYTEVFKFIQWLGNKKFNERLRSAIECDRFKRDKPVFEAWRKEGVQNEGNPFEFPCMALLAYKEANSEFSFKCNAFLVSEKFVLTVASCAARNPIFVRLGAASKSMKDMRSKPIATDNQIKKIIIHERYSRSQAKHDIALLELNEPAKLNYFVWPACLYVPVDNSKKIWLAVSRPNDEDTIDNRKKYIMKIPVDEVSVDDNDCDETVRKSSGGLQTKISNDQFCVKSLIQDVVLCESNIGAALQISGDDFCFTGGLVSFVNDCKKNKPVLVTRISSYIEWIEERVWPDEDIEISENKFNKLEKFYDFIFPND